MEAAFPPAPHRVVESPDGDTAAALLATAPSGATLAEANLQVQQANKKEGRRGRNPDLPQVIDGFFKRGTYAEFDNILQNSDDTGVKFGIWQLVRGSYGFAKTENAVKDGELEKGSAEYEGAITRVHGQFRTGLDAIDGKPVPQLEGTQGHGGVDRRRSPESRHEYGQALGKLPDGLQPSSESLGAVTTKDKNGTDQIAGSIEAAKALVDTTVSGVRQALETKLDYVFVRVCGGLPSAGQACGGSETPKPPTPPVPGPGPVPDPVPTPTPGPVEDGQGQLDQGNPRQAAETFDRAIERDPWDVRAIAGRAQASYMMGDYRLATGFSKAALSHEPGNQAAFATLRLSENRSPKASASAASAAAAAGGGNAELFAASAVTGAGASSGFKLDATRPEAVQSAAQVKLAEKALRVGDFAAARSYSTRALELNPKNGQALFYRSVVNANGRDYAGALADAEAGLALVPNNAALLNSKAFALNRMGKYKDALAASEAALLVNPRDASALANRAYAVGGLGDRAAMLENLRAAASIDPRFQSSLESALQMPDDSDLLFLFPGEAGPAHARSGAVPERGKSRSLRTLGLAVVGVLLAAGLFAFATGGRRDAALPAAAGNVPAPADGPVPQQGVSTLLRNQYEIIRQIGAGGMGVVFEGLDRALRRKVAIKKMREEIRLNAKERERFLTEAKTVASLHHPNVVDIYSIVEDDDVYLVFEHVSGATLHERIHRDGPLPLAEAVAVFQGIAAALDAAHGRGIIHRDLKPSNVMIDEEGSAKVMDFGVARVAKDAAGRYSMTNTVMGTPPYMAPEQETGVVRKEGDVYSMAICLYETLTGQQPFAGMGAGMLLNKMNASFAPATKTNPVLPQGIDAVFSKAFAADPDKRYASAGEFMKAVEAAAGVPKA
ncbi:MAG: protein kinase [Elusimicrobia bacterium]|nr:protein kinase [Elusimicrobiota bacterium]